MFKHNLHVLAMVVVVVLVVLVLVVNQEEAFAICPGNQPTPDISKIEFQFDIDAELIWVMF